MKCVCIKGKGKHTLHVGTMYKVWRQRIVKNLSGASRLHTNVHGKENATQKIPDKTIFSP